MKEFSQNLGENPWNVDNACMMITFYKTNVEGTSFYYSMHDRQGNFSLPIPSPSTGGVPSIVEERIPIPLPPAARWMKKSGKSSVNV